MRKMTLFRHIAAAITRFICFDLHNYQITNVYHQLDIASMQELLKIHYLHWEKKPFCLEHGYFGAVNTGSDYVGFFFIRQGAETSFLHKGN